MRQCQPRNGAGHEETPYPNLVGALKVGAHAIVDGFVMVEIYSIPKFYTMLLSRRDPVELAGKHSNKNTPAALLL